MTSPLFDVEINPSDVGNDKQLVKVFDRIETLNSGESNCMHVRINIDLKVDRNALKFAINAKDFGALACAMDIPVGEILNLKVWILMNFKLLLGLGGMNEASIGTIWCRNSQYGYNIIKSEKNCKRRAMSRLIGYCKE